MLTRCFCFLTLVLCGCISVYVNAGQVHPEFTRVEFDKEKTYVFYSHGFIVEGNDPKPVHPRWGEYDFPAVTQALAKSGFEVIAYHRPKGLEFKAYAKKLAQQVNTLLEYGVPAHKITLLGFSRGGRITAHASHWLANENINTVIMAGCGGWVNNNEPWVQINGSFLSVVEASDNVGTCQLLKNRSKNVPIYDEININTGKEHGAFYTPVPAWLNPVTEWITHRATHPE